MMYLAWPRMVAMGVAVGSGVALHAKEAKTKDELPDEVIACVVGESMGISGPGMVKLRAKAMDAVRKGAGGTKAPAAFVLDGIPKTKARAELLCEAGLRPDAIVVMRKGADQFGELCSVWEGVGRLDVDGSKAAEGELRRVDDLFDEVV